MASAASSSMSHTASTSASSSSSQKHRRPKPSRADLLKALEILGPLGNPLPPQLPSPPASRHNSPASAGSKRKADPQSEQSTNKKPRTSSISDTARRIPPSAPQPDLNSHSKQAPTLRSDPPSEDGELREDSAVVVHDPAPVLQSNVPVARQRRGSTLPSRYHDDLHDKYHSFGRQLKYSGDTRLWSTFSPRDPGYRPLLNPPHPGSPYHKFGNLVGRLELVDALVCFAYSLWNKDYGRKACHRPSWSTIESFLSYSKHKWEQAQSSADEREKAFIGLIWMIEAFIHGRKFAYACKAIDKENAELFSKLRADWVAEAEKEVAKAGERESKPSPGMLPSPESIAGTSSANSTPTSRPGDTPSVSAGARPNSGGPSSRYLSAQEQLMQAHRSDTLPPSRLTVPVNANFLSTRKSQSGGINAAHWCMDNSSKYLTLPIMAKHYPRTFSRMMYSSYAATDEHEPDIEDEEGELFWPGQLVTGEGLGWVCTMGKAMIKEFGKDIHYLGLDGVIQKPDPVEVETPSASRPAAPSSSVAHEPSPHPIPVQR
ncbi:hypothetical protein EUX98_g3782 [Antrodiella citrinella]|uniref:Uncharacterized protein n=1 Tax=Antrodiella citrinella TaxID=2447956 RepID=A0A4S4MWS3_9APHY|nr:hypothetical protein EUX98_g3782 [Antrodiella citrinella]